MSTPSDTSAGFRLPTGTQVVTLRDVVGQNQRTLHPRGAVGVIVKSSDAGGAHYRVKFPDGVEEVLLREELDTLSGFQSRGIVPHVASSENGNLFDRVILRCVIGSQAYGLADEKSDVDRRGVFLPPGRLHWSLAGVPEQIENDATQELYWEVQKFLVLALKANPNVLECLYSPQVEHASPIGRELLEMRQLFMSRLLYQTFNGYVLSQFRKIQADLRNQGHVKWKHVMHLIRLLLSGRQALRTGEMNISVGLHREQLLAIKRGELPWEEVEHWRRSLHREFDAAFAATQLPERPDYQRVNEFLLRVRRSAVE